MLNQENQGKEIKLLKAVLCEMCNGSGLVTRTVFDKYHRDHIIFVRCDCMPKIDPEFTKTFLKRIYNILKEKGLVENLEKQLFKR